MPYWYDYIQVRPVVGERSHLSRLESCAMIFMSSQNTCATFILIPLKTPSRCSPLLDLRDVCAAQGTRKPRGCTPRCPDCRSFLHECTCRGIVRKDWTVATEPQSSPPDSSVRSMKRPRAAMGKDAEISVMQRERREGDEGTMGAGVGEVRHEFVPYVCQPGVSTGVSVGNRAQDRDANVKLEIQGGVQSRAYEVPSVNAPESMISAGLPPGSAVVRQPSISSHGEAEQSTETSRLNSKSGAIATISNYGHDSDSSLLEVSSSQPQAKARNDGDASCGVEEKAVVGSESIPTYIANMPTHVTEERMSKPSASRVSGQDDHRASPGGGNELHSEGTESNQSDSRTAGSEDNGFMRTPDIGDGHDREDTEAAGTSRETRVVPAGDETAMSVGSIGERPERTRISASSIDVDNEQTQHAPSSGEQPSTQIQYQKGDLVEVERRMMPGVNKPGGTGRVVKVHAATGKIDVRYVVEGGWERAIDPVYVQLAVLDLSEVKRPTLGRCRHCGSLQVDCKQECEYYMALRRPPPVPKLTYTRSESNPSRHLSEYGDEAKVDPENGSKQLEPTEDRHLHSSRDLDGVVVGEAQRDTRRPRRRLPDDWDEEGLPMPGSDDDDEWRLDSRSQEVEVLGDSDEAESEGEFARRDRENRRDAALADAAHDAHIGKTASRERSGGNGSDDVGSSSDVEYLGVKTSSQGGDCVRRVRRGTPCQDSDEDMNALSSDRAESYDSGDGFEGAMTSRWSDDDVGDLDESGMSQFLMPEGEEASRALPSDIEDPTRGIKAPAVLRRELTNFIRTLEEQDAQNLEKDVPRVCRCVGRTLNPLKLGHFLDLRATSVYSFSCTQWPI